MSYILAKMITDALTQLGKGQEYLASGGSTTTVVCAEFGTAFAEEDFEGSSVIITQADAAAPENEWAAIETYDQEATELTLYTALTVAVQAGDNFLVSGAEYPIPEMVRLANIALSDFGSIAYIEELAIGSSDTTIEVTEEYLSGVCDLFFKPDGGDRFLPVPSFRLVPADPPQIDFYTPLGSGTLQVWRDTVHPDVIDPSDVISSSIPPALASMALAVEALQWQIMRQGTDDTALQSAMANLVNKLEDKKRRHKIRRPKRRPRTMGIQRLS
jgi:hypothetical protein